MAGAALGHAKSARKSRKQNESTKMHSPVALYSNFTRPIHFNTCSTIMFYYSKPDIDAICCFQLPSTIACCSKDSHRVSYRFRKLAKVTIAPWPCRRLHDPDTISLGQIGSVRAHYHCLEIQCAWTGPPISHANRACAACTHRGCETSFL